jgi:hypothetical protein
MATAAATASSSITSISGVDARRELLGVSDTNGFHGTATKAAKFGSLVGEGGSPPISPRHTKALVTDTDALLASPEASPESSAAPFHDDSPPRTPPKMLPISAAASDREIRRELLAPTSPITARSSNGYTMVSFVDRTRDLGARIDDLNGQIDRNRKMIAASTKGIELTHEKLSRLEESEAAKKEKLRVIDRQIKTTALHIKIAYILCIILAIAAVTMIILKCKYPHKF